MAQDFAAGTMVEEREGRTRNITAQRKDPVNFPPRNFVYPWNLFLGK